MPRASVMLLAGAALLLASLLPALMARAAPTLPHLCSGATDGRAAALHWIGSLQGWPESTPVLAWRAAVARAKGRPTTCG